MFLKTNLINFPLKIIPYIISQRNLCMMSQFPLPIISSPKKYMIKISLKPERMLSNLKKVLKRCISSTAGPSTRVLWTQPVQSIKMLSLNCHDVILSSKMDEDVMCTNIKTVHFAERTVAERIIVKKTRVVVAVCCECQ